MTRLEYNEYRVWTLPEDEDGDDTGYLVEQLGDVGHVAWLPSDVFEDTYKDVSTGVSFGDAVILLKEGKKVARLGWNGKGMFLFLVAGSTFKVNRAPLLGIYPEGTEINYCPHIDMKTADDKVIPWLASQSDVLADDWILVE
jgi:hypothetical protein